MLDEKELARKGAQVMIAELQEFISNGEPRRVARRKKKVLSAAARKKIGERMKQYWASQREAKEKAPAAKGRGARKSA